MAYMEPNLRAKWHSETQPENATNADDMKPPVPPSKQLLSVKYALCSGRELSINLQCQTNNESTLVPGNLTRVKQRGAAAGYGIPEEVTGGRPCEGFFISSLLKSRRRFEDGVLEMSTLDYL